MNSVRLLGHYHGEPDDRVTASRRKSCPKGDTFKVAVAVEQRELGLDLYAPVDTLSGLLVSRLNRLLKVGTRSALRNALPRSLGAFRATQCVLPTEIESRGVGDKCSGSDALQELEVDMASGN